MIELQAPSAEVLKRAIKFARGREVCAFLLESSAGEQDVLCVPNADPSVGSFHVPDYAVEQARRYAAQRGMSIAAFIHSHRSGLDLSEADAASQHETRFPWIVVRLGNDCLEWQMHPCSHDDVRNQQHAVHLNAPS